MRKARCQGEKPMESSRGFAGTIRCISSSRISRYGILSVLTGINQRALESCAPQISETNCLLKLQWTDPSNAIENAAVLRRLVEASKCESRASFKHQASTNSTATLKKTSTAWNQAAPEQPTNTILRCSITWVRAVEDPPALGLKKDKSRYPNDFICNSKPRLSLPYYIRTRVALTACGGWRWRQKRNKAICKQCGGVLFPKMLS